MKIHHFILVALLLCTFTFTQVASAYTAPSLAALQVQLQGLLLQLNALLGLQHEELAATVITPVDSGRHCDVTLVTFISGKEISTTRTVYGSATDRFAVGLALGTALPFTETIHSLSGASVGYFTPNDYAKNKALLDTMVSDPHYKIMSAALADTNSPKTGHTFPSSGHPYVEARVVNTAVSGYGAGTVAILALVSNCVEPPIVKPTTKKPNIVFVLTDDLDIQMMKQLPKLKTLMADKGMTFDNHFVSLSLCCPSRAATLCGQYAHNNGVFTNEEVNSDGTLGALAAFTANGGEKKTMAVWLQNAGYNTVLLGKYLNGYEKYDNAGSATGIDYDLKSVPVGWSNWVVPLEGHPYSQYNFSLNVTGTKEDYYLQNCNRGKAPVDSHLCTNNLPGATFADKDANYMLNVLQKKANEYVKQSAQLQKPLFMYLAPFAPHSPANPSPKYAQLLDASSTAMVKLHGGTVTSAAWTAANSLPRPPSFNEADISDKPAWMQLSAKLTGGQVHALNFQYQKRLASMYVVEDMMESLITTLTNTIDQQTGEPMINNTYIVFTSDNGYHLGEHRLEAGKLTGFDTDIHVPLIIRGPGIAAGVTQNALTANVDFAPTFADIAGISIPTSVDGRSFKPLLSGKNIPYRKALLLEHANPGGFSTKIQNLMNEARDGGDPTAPLKGGELVGKYIGLRTPQYTYIKYSTTTYSRGNEEELYDDLKDPYQLNNIALTVNPDMLKKLREWAVALSHCKGETCRSIEASTTLSNAIAEVASSSAQSCLWGGRVIASGARATFYTKPTMLLGHTCLSQVISCTNGMLSPAEYTSASSAYVYDSCRTLGTPTITPAKLTFTRAAQNIAPPTYDAAHGFQTSVAEPAITYLTLAGRPYVYMLLREERKTDRGTRLSLSRIPAEKFSVGNIITKRDAWETLPDAAFTVTTPKNASGVLATAMVALNGKLLITYQARRIDGAPNDGYMMLYDPSQNKPLWTKPVTDLVQYGYKGNSTPTGLTRVTADPISKTGTYFDSNQGRALIGFTCKDATLPVCNDKGQLWKGLLVQEITLSYSTLTGYIPTFHTPIRLYKEEISDTTTLAQWKKAGEKVWKKQNFMLHNAGNDSLLFSLTYSLVSDADPTRDFPGHFSFFTLTEVSQVLKDARSTTAPALDVSNKMPQSKTWTQDLNNDSSWDQGAIWNSMIYVDPFHVEGNKTFVLYESWGSEYLQLPQTRTALYGGSGAQKIAATRPEFSLTVDTYCRTHNISGGGARKPYTLSASAFKPGSFLQGTEIPHDVPMNSITDPVTKAKLDAVYVVCSDIGTSDTLPANIKIISAVVDAQLAGKTVWTASNELCRAKGATTFIWSDVLNPSVGTKQFNADNKTIVTLGQTITTACSLPGVGYSYIDTSFMRHIIALPGQSCDMACNALGVGDGTGYRSYRTKIQAPLSLYDGISVLPYMSLGLYAATPELSGKVWQQTDKNSNIECTCGPGREMRGITSAKVVN